MDIVLIVVIVLVAIALIALLAVTGKKKREEKQEEHRHEAREIRQEAQVHGHQADRAKAEADEAAARSRREEAAAKEAAAKAEHAGRQRDAHHAEANRIDPDADDDAPLGDPHSERARHDRASQEGGRGRDGHDRGRQAATDQTGAVPTQPGAPPPADQQGAPREPGDPGTSAQPRRGEPGRGEPRR